MLTTCKQQISTSRLQEPCLLVHFVRDVVAETFYFHLSGPDQPRGPPSGDSADREAYRRGPAQGMEPKGGAGSDFRPEFVSWHCLCSGVAV